MADHPIHQNFPGLTAEEKEGPLRVVRGRINSTPVASILVGTGFTINRTAVGTVTVTFTLDFAGIPAVLLTKGGGTVGDVSTNAVAVGSFQALIANAAGALVDSTFNFLAIGPA